MRCGSTTAVMSSHCAVHSSNCGSRTSAATAVIAFTASTMRRIVPRLRRSGSSRRDGVLPYNRLHNETGMQASCRKQAAVEARRRGGVGGYCRQPPSARQAEPGRRSVSGFGRGRRAALQRRRRRLAVNRSDRHGRPQAAASVPLAPAPDGWSGRFAEPVSRHSSSATPRRWISIAGWPPSTSGARSRTRACWPPWAC